MNDKEIAMIESMLTAIRFAASRYPSYSFAHIDRAERLLNEIRNHPHDSVEKSDDWNFSANTPVIMRNNRAFNYAIIPQPGPINWPPVYREDWDHNRQEYSIGEGNE